MKHIKAIAATTAATIEIDKGKVTVVIANTPILALICRVSQNCSSHQQ